MPVYMPRTSDHSSILTIRVPRALAQKLAREARRQRRTRSAVARDLIVASLDTRAEGDLAAEARRQSLRARQHRAEPKALQLIAEVADLRGWE
jgi:predicted transcriptional regulator